MFPLGWQGDWSFEETKNVWPSGWLGHQCSKNHQDFSSLGVDILRQMRSQVLDSYMLEVEEEEKEGGMRRRREAILASKQDSSSPWRGWKSFENASPHFISDDGMSKKHRQFDLMPLHKSIYHSEEWLSKVLKAETQYTLAQATVSWHLKHSIGADVRPHGLGCMGEQGSRELLPPLGPHEYTTEVTLKQ